MRRTQIESRVNIALTDAVPDRFHASSVRAAVLALGLFLGTASALAAQTRPVRDSLSAADWGRDLSTLVTELERLHPNLFHRRAKADFTADLETLRGSIRSSDDVRLSLGIQRLVASLGDGHTSVNLDGRALGLSRLPISPYVFDDGVFIRDADAHLADLIGARILGIGPLPIDTVLQRLLAYVATETQAWARERLPSQLVVAQVLREIGAAGGVDSVTLDVVDRDGRRRNVVVATMPFSAEVQWSLLRLVPLDSLPLFRRRSTSNYWYEYLEGARTMVIGYNRAANDTANPLDAFGARLDEELRRRDVRRIVVDFRLNSGGNSSLFRAIERPILAHKRRHPGTELIGIIGRRTFSSALWNASDFQREAGATLYGETAGGRPNHFGEVRQLTLPHSGIRIQHSTRAWRRIPDADPPTLEPDVAVPVLASDHFALRDAALLRILGAPR